MGNTVTLKCPKVIQILFTVAFAVYYCCLFPYFTITTKAVYILQVYFAVITYLFQAQFKGIFKTVLYQNQVYSDFTPSCTIFFLLELVMGQTIKTTEMCLQCRVVYLSYTRHSPRRSFWAHPSVLMTTHKTVSMNTKTGASRKRRRKIRK